MLFLMDHHKQLALPKPQFTLLERTWVDLSISLNDMQGGRSRSVS